MPLFLPVDFTAALSENKQGHLSDDQKKSLEHTLGARKVTGYLLFFCGLLQAAIAVPASLLADWEPNELRIQITVSVYALLAVACAIWGLIIVKQASAARVKVATLPVKTISGTPAKYNYATPVKVAGATHALILKAGWLKINGIAYGVLPGGLYMDIPSDQENTFYYIELPATGFKKHLIVNFS